LLVNWTAVAAAFVVGFLAGAALCLVIVVVMVLGMGLQ
jgi:hypothetical protein